MHDTSDTAAELNGAEVPAAADAGFTLADAPPDPLNNLIGRATVDPGVPFAEDVIASLIHLRSDNRAAYETLRARLKVAKVRVTALDRVIAQSSGGETERQTQANLLLELASAANLFHTSDKTAYADIVIADHRETWPVRSKGFRRWLGRAYYETHGGAPNAEAIQSALGVIEARAHYDAPERVIFLRIGEHSGKLYVDLGDETWRAVEIDAEGWRIVAEPPVRFRRAAGMLPLPEPTRGGSLDSLRALLNVDSDDDFRLAVAWLLAAFRPTGPYPVLIVAGEGGSAKTTFVLILRSLVDPNTSALRSLPREDRDLFIAANNGHVLAFDNVSGLQTWISDTLCRLSTGGGFAVRTLYSDAEETLFDAMRPIALNGIEDIVARADLADRGLFLTLTRIPDNKRREDAAVRAELEAHRPAILGALLDAVVHGLSRLPHTKMDRLPRLADFARWVAACGDELLWPPSSFVDAYFANRRGVTLDVIEADPVATAVKALVERDLEVERKRDPAALRTVRTQTATDLMASLKEIAGEVVARSKTWPESPRALSGRLRRAATFLRAAGIEVEFKTAGHAKTRTIVISASSEVGKFASAPSAAQESRSFRADDADASPHSMVRIDASTVRTVHSPSAETPQKSAIADDADDADAKIPTWGGLEYEQMAEGEI
jgi:hypothetical protein